MHDVIIIGGSYAGLSAAIQIARARRRVAIIDAGLRRNRFASHSHGFFGRDGHAPATIVNEAKAQLLAYPGVSWFSGTAVEAGGAIDDFRVTMANGETVRGRRIILSTGVEDVLPEIPGLAAQWGIGAMTCPYCHGYELEQGHIGVLATGPHSIHQAMMLPEWGTTTFFLNEAVELDAKTAAELSRRGVAVEPAAVRAVEGEPGSPTLALADGRAIRLAGLFVATRIRMASPVATMLGCAMDESPFGEIISADAMKQTSVPGVIACGDVTRGAGSVAIAVGDGAFAGTVAHRSLIFPADIEKQAA